MALIIDSDIVDKLVCNECGRYLSVGPVKITKNEGTLCGRCSAGRPGAPSMLNVLARSALFPCVNRFEGCSELLASSEVTEHEEQCTSHEFACEIPNCTFVGPSLQLLKHFKSSHREHVIDFPEVFFQVIKDFRNIYVYLKENHMYYVSVSYKKTKKTISVSVKSVVDGSLTAARIRLRNIAGEILYDSGAKRQVTPIVVEVSKIYFVKAVVVLSFDVDTHTACFYPSSVVAKVASSGREPPSSGADCEIFDEGELAGYGSFFFRINNFGELSGDYVVASRPLMGRVWSVIAETNRICDETREFLTVTVCCTPQEDMTPADFELDLALTSKVTTDLEIRRTQKFCVEDETTHCVFENFAEYSDILDRDRGLVTGGSLMFKVGFREFVKIVLRPDTNRYLPAKCSISVIEERVEGYLFKVEVTHLRTLPDKHRLVSNTHKIFEGMCHVSVTPTFLYEGNIRKFLSLTVVYAPESNSKIAFDIDLVLESSISNKIQIKETRTCTVSSKVNVTTNFENFVSYRDIFDSNKGFRTDDETLMFRINVKKRTNTTNSSVSVPPKLPIRETTVIDHSCEMADSSSRQAKVRDLLWQITTAPWVVNGKRHLSVYLHCSPERHDVIWACKANVTFMLVGEKGNVSKSIEHVFHEGESGKGILTFADAETVMKEDNGFLQNDVLTIRVLLMTETPKFRMKKIENE